MTPATAAGAAAAVLPATEAADTEADKVKHKAAAAKLKAAAAKRLKTAASNVKAEKSDGVDAAKFNSAATDAEGTKKINQPPAAAAAASDEARPASAKANNNSNKKSKPSPAAERVDHEAAIHREREEVVQRAKELKALNEAAKVGLDTYLEAL